MHKHPLEGYKLLQRIGFLQKAAEIVYTHHERYDGSGYPRGLKGDEIPLGARLFAVADVFDALTSTRPYHAAMEFEEALNAIRKMSGMNFDPAVVKTFEVIRPEEWERIRSRYDEADQM